MIRINVPEAAHEPPLGLARPFDRRIDLTQVGFLDASLERIREKVRDAAERHAFRPSIEDRNAALYATTKDVWVSFRDEADDETRDEPENATRAVFVVRDRPADIILTRIAFELAVRDPLVIDASILHAVSHLSGDDLAFPRLRRLHDRDHRARDRWLDRGRGYCEVCCSGPRPRVA